MDIPVSTPSKIPRQLGLSTPATAQSSSSTPATAPSSSSTSRRRTPSPPTSRPTSSRYSPPLVRERTSSVSPTSSGRLPSKRERTPPLTTRKDENDDTAKMPPPPTVPSGRSVGLRRAAKPEEKRRTGSVSGSSGKPSKAEDEKSVAAATGKGLGKLLSLKPSASSSKLAKGTTESEQSKRGSVRSRAATVDRAPEKAEGVGRAMSMRSTTKAAGKTESTSTVRTRAGTTTTKQRPVSMYGATNTSKQDLQGTASSSVKRPSTSSNSATSMPPPPAPPTKGHRKSSSSVTAASVQSAITAVPAPAGANAAARPTTAGSTKSKRPAFSTTSQDFAAAANPIPPPTPRSKALPPAPVDTQTMHAQTQLLQLLTLHSSSAAVYQQLITSATTTLKSRFEKLSARHYDARETSLKKQKRHNLDSLAAVVNNVVPGKKRRDTSKSPEERVQAFSEAIKRIDAMRSGEFRKLCGVFGEWIAGYNPRSGASKEKWVDGIGEVWRRECVGISRRLEVSIAGVDGVAGVLAEHGEEEAVVTTVTRVAEGYKDLAEGMLEEVEMMRRMEIEVVERERVELKRRVEFILEVGCESGYSRTAIWVAS